jgi:hypothetical protein
MGRRVAARFRLHARECALELALSRARIPRARWRSAIAPGEFLVRTLRDLDEANRQLVALLEARKTLRDERYDHTPEDYARRVEALQQQVDAVIARIQSLHQIIQHVRD